MKQRIAIVAALMVIIAAGSYADPISDIVTMLSQIEQYQQAMQGLQSQMVNFQSDIDQMQKDIKGEITHYMTGNYGWGTYNLKDFGSYGTSAQDWQSVLAMAQSGGNAGALGQVIGKLAGDFPIQTNTINKTIPDPTLQKYYALEAQTTLASRAASQLDYNKIQDQVQYQQSLRQQIEKTTDLKAAVDLQNRLQSENNLIQLELLRQLALINQQQSVTSQATVNNAVEDANFLSH